MHNEYDIVHFSGHANSDGLFFEDINQRPNLVPMSAIKTTLTQYPTIKCIILNAASSVKALENLFAGYHRDGPEQPLPMAVL